jgi:hypothetical protein
MAKIKYFKTQTIASAWIYQSPRWVKVFLSNQANTDMANRQPVREREFLFSVCRTIAMCIAARSGRISLGITANCQRAPQDSRSQRTHETVQCPDRALGWGLNLDGLSVDGNGSFLGILA